MNICCTESRGCLVSQVLFPHLSSVIAPGSPFSPHAPLTWFLPFPHPPSSVSSAISLPPLLDSIPPGAASMDFLGFWDSWNLGKVRR